MRYSYGFSDWRGMVGSTGGDVAVEATGLLNEEEVAVASAKSRKK